MVFIPTTVRTGRREPAGPCGPWPPARGRRRASAQVRAAAARSRADSEVDGPDGLLDRGGGARGDAELADPEADQQRDRGLVGGELAADRDQHVVPGARAHGRRSARARRGRAGRRARRAASLPRSAASAYWVRSLVPMLKKSTCGANAAAFSAAAGTSTMIPTCRPAGRPGRRGSTASSSTRRAAMSSSSVLTIGNITLDRGLVRDPHDREQLVGEQLAGGPARAGCRARRGTGWPRAACGR